MKNKLSFILIISFIIVGCNGNMNNQNKKQRAVSQSSQMTINAVMKANTQKLMSMPGVVGVYVGMLEDSTECIKVMAVEKSEALEKKLPTELNGYPVVIHVTGKMKSM